MTSTSGWISVTVKPSNAERFREALIAALFEAGAQGVHENGEQLETHFPPASDMETVCEILQNADEDVQVTLVPAEDVDWSEAWKSKLGVRDAGAFAIVPTWLAEGRDPNTTIVIEPGMAFGTGDHPTTRGVVRLLPAVMSEGDIVADLGAGSAVLSIAAAKMGAARVYAIELDADAIPDAELNVQRNEVSDRVHIFEGDAAALLPLLSPVRVIVANIISSVLVELLPLVRSSLTDDGAAILSGILVEERDTMLSILTASGWNVLQEDHEDIWWSVSIAKA